MKKILLWLLLPLVVWGVEIETYATLGIASHHFSSREDGRAFNQRHDAFGAEVVFDHRYTIAYLHFENSRDRTTDIGALGYRYPLYGPFGFYGVVGYQKGYCFEGLRSVECTAGKDDSGLAFLPMLYYAHERFTLDLIGMHDMIGLKFNLKLF